MWVVEYVIRFWESIYGRLQRDPTSVKDKAQQVKIGGHLLAEAESGWDFNPRFDTRCMDFNPVDLNSNLYIYEKNFAYFAEQLRKDDAGIWLDRANKRKDLMSSLMVNPENGLYYDYDFVNGKLYEVYSAAGFSPLYAGLASPQEAEATLAKGLPKLEMAHGIAACEDISYRTVYQWDYPNSWAPLNVIVIKGLDNYGYKQEAQRVASKYRDATLEIFNSTQNLWEKYNAQSGDIDAKNEYGLPGSFMGWTAGAYMFTHNYLKNIINQKEKDRN